MNPVVVRYKTRPDASDENQKLIEAVFAELNETQPASRVTPDLTERRTPPAGCNSRTR